MGLVTIECSQPRDVYSLFEHGPRMAVHLAGPSNSGGTGPILCGFDRHARDPEGRYLVGFSVGGGVSGPGVNHDVCAECFQLAGGAAITGTHANLFAGGAAR